MSEPSQNEEKKNTKGKANATAAWEWFKSAAWLQVLLIVAVVVGIVVSIPYIVSAIQDAIDSDNSDFFDGKRITYDKLLDFMDGSDTSCDGSLGNGTYDDDESENSFSSTKTGFVVVFYKDNCDNCDSIESRLEDWFEDFNSDYARTYGEQIKLYAINVGWDPGDEEDSEEYESAGDTADYKNTDISLEEQNSVMQNLMSVYLSQTGIYRNDSVTRETLETDLTDGSGTMPTPTFVTYSKEKGSSDGYVIDEPDKVYFGMIGSLSTTSRSDIAKQMQDLYGFRKYTEY